MPAYALPPLPAFSPDAAANDRFDLRLSRAALAVVHCCAPRLHDRTIARPAMKVAFDRTQILNGASQ